MEQIQKHRNLILFEGILILILGLLAIALPTLFTLKIALILGVLLLIIGFVKVFTSFKTKEVPGFLYSLLIGLLYIVVGALMLRNPIAGVLTLTFLLICFFIIDGVAKIFLGFTMRNLPNWGWIIFSGVLSLIMAGIIFGGWPETALWVIGLLLGINFVFYGISLISLALSLKKL